MRHKLGMLVLVGTILATAQALGSASSGAGNTACPPGCCVESCSVQASATEACAPCPLPCAPEACEVTAAVATD